MVSRRKAARYCHAIGYTEVRAEKPADRDEAKLPEFKSCEFTTDAIVTDGTEVGSLRKVCTNAELIGEPRLEVLAKQHGIKRSKDAENIAKLFAAYLHRADEGTLSRVAVELTIVLTAARSNAPSVLRESAIIYKMDTEAIAQKVKAEFAAKAKATKEAKPAATVPPKAKKAA